jgi:hypothetical protein
MIAMLPHCGNRFLSFYFFALTFKFPLFHTDCFGGTGIDTDPAVNARIGINAGFFFSHTYGFARALFQTALATSTFFLVYFSRHLNNPFNKN